MPGRPHLRALADRVGILSEYTDLDNRIHATVDASYVMLLEAMGYPAATEEDAESSLQEIQRAERERMLPPVTVVAQSALRSHVFHASLKNAEGAARACRITVAEENGQTHEWELLVDSQRELRFPVLLDLPLGYHRLSVAFGGLHAEQSLIVVPDRCYGVEQATGSREIFGVCANLYTVRSSRNWGVGDFSDLGVMSQWAASNGAAFFGLNPLHAIRNAGYEISPYSPLSRLFRNVAYLDVEVVPELMYSAEAQKRIQSTDFRLALAECRQVDRILHEKVLDLKLGIMRLLHREFLRRGRDVATDRCMAYDKFIQQQAEALEKFATFAALEEHLAGRGHQRYWPSWPREYQTYESAAVRDFRGAHAEDVDFHKYLQFELDRQLREAAEACRRGGMSIGLYQDLAIGTAPGGADTWVYPRLFVNGARIGAPPDDYSRKGQDWGLPPIHPIRLREDQYQHWRRLLQANMAHSGALRIDHVMGLLRQYWIPPGATALDGAYVAYPAADLFGILALESHRHRSVVIGEDLGTVPAGFTQLLERYGILSCEVLQFQRDHQGNFKPPAHYSNRALVTSTTHDHPSMASFWTGEDLLLRRKLGIIESDEALTIEQERRERDRAALLRALGMQADVTGMPEVRYAELCAAIHHFLAQTPAPLMGVMLDDLSAELEPINMPGVPPEKHDCWRRRMRMTLEEIMTSADVAQSLSGSACRAEPHPQPIS